MLLRGLWCVVLVAWLSHPALAQTTAVRLAWDAPSEGAWPAGVGVSIDRQADCAGQAERVGTVPDARVGRFVDESAVRGQRYCYTAVAFDPFGESAPSNTAEVAVPHLGAPTGVRVELVITIPLGQ
jgi:hypothetical protein